MKVRKKLIMCLMLAAVLPMAILGYGFFTFPWEVSWVKSATSLTLSDPDRTLTGEDLDNFLKGFDSDNAGYLGLSCRLAVRKGSIRINNEDYPVDYVYDKFLGELLVVHGRCKEIWVSRPAEVEYGRLKF